MARSYRKHGVWKDHRRAGSAKSWKRLANRAFRRSKKYEVSNKGKEYKKITGMTWEIHDYKWLTTEKEAREYYRQNVDHPWRGLWLQEYRDEEDYINKYWKKSIRK